MTLAPRIVQSRIGSRVVHPGEILWEQFMIPFQISQNALARRMGVPPRRINEIVNGKRAITADTAIGLARVFGTSEHFWMTLQSDFELETARERQEATRDRCRPAPEGDFDPVGIDIPWDGER